MTVRAIGANSITRTPGHKDTTNIIAAGDEISFVFDDTKITTLTKLNLVLADIRTAMLGSGYINKNL